ncbi:MAG: ATP-dependent helicase, partial [Actinomycetota bacterium]|nr:ATP-dependent helicase [Actinomycetota bacterium]
EDLGGKKRGGTVTRAKRTRGTRARTNGEVREPSTTRAATSEDVTEDGSRPRRRRRRRAGEEGAESAPSTVPQSDAPTAETNGDQPARSRRRRRRSGVDLSTDPNANDTPGSAD